MTFEELMEQDGRIVFTCRGTSMMPLLRENRDIMIIEPRDAYHKLDAVLFRRFGIEGRGAYVLHRILRVNKDGTYWIAGDNCVSGETVLPEQILGVMTAVVRDGKKTDMSSITNKIYCNTWCRWYHIRFALLKGKHLAGRAVRAASRIVR